jgi:hypothetical protein
MTEAALHLAAFFLCKCFWIFTVIDCKSSNKHLFGFACNLMCINPF